MQLTVRDIAKFLSLSEKTVYRWVKDGDIPAYRIGDQYRFNRLEILEWATARKIDTAPDTLLGGSPEKAALPSLSDAIENGGIFRGVGGTDRQSALKAIVECLRLPPGTDKEAFHQILLAREELSSTGIGEGIAIPHVRTPAIMHVDQPQLTLCFLDHPIEFEALDGKPVYALFTLICPTIESHLHLLSRLAFALRDSSFKKSVRDREENEKIFHQIAQAENKLSKK